MSDTKKEEVPVKDVYVKPGWKTSEFWVMLCSVIFGILILLGVMTNSESNTMLAYVNNIMGSLVTIVSVLAYILSRGKAKQGQINYTKLVEDIRILVQENNDKLEGVMDRKLVQQKEFMITNKKKW